MNEKLEVPKDADKWWEKFEKLDEEEKVSFVNATIDAELPEKFRDDLDFFEAVSDVFHYLASADKLKNAAGLVEKLKAKRPALYEKDSNWYGSLLLYYYAPFDKKRVEEVAKDVIDNVNEDDIDVLFTILDVLRLYGYGEETKKLSIAAYNRLKDSGEILPHALVELENLAILSVFREHISEKRNTNPDLVLRGMRAAGLGVSKKTARYLADVFNATSERRWSRDDFSASNKNLNSNAHELLFEFLKYMHERHSVGLITSDLFHILIAEYLARLAESKKNGLIFIFSDRHLDEYLAEYLNVLSLQQTRGMAILPALTYFYRFLHWKKLISETELKASERAIEKFKPSAKKVVGDELWKYRFLLSWKLDGKQMYDESYFRQEGNAV